ncbi:hypothetical protein JNN96_28635 [Mycobacterium sp. DSM 3803]|nr:hypothetical protein [Mycobacterium sp. DSM 3803]
MLAAGLIAVPGVPMVAADWLLSESQDESSDLDTHVSLVTDDGFAIDVAVPPGWQVSSAGDSAVLRTDGALVLIDVHDRSGRDPRAIAQRLARINRVQGINTALDGGQIATGDDTLTGDTCVAVSANNRTGPCAYIADDDVVVGVVALGSPDHSAPPLSDIVGSITRTQP